MPRALVLAAAAWTAAFWLGCVGVPLAALFSRLAAEGWEKAWARFADPSVVAVARATFTQAAASTALSAALGFPLGLWLGSRGRIPRWAETLLILPYGVPGVVAALAWVTWLGRSGWLAQLGLGPGVGFDWAYSLKAVILAHVFLNVPLVALVVAQARAQEPRAAFEAAATLGASRWNVFRFVSWPRARWALASASAQVLALCTMSFALVLVLGGGPPVETLETALYGRIRFGSLDLPGAAACALWELCLTLAPWVLLLIIQASARAGAPAQAPPRAARSSRGDLVLGACLVGLVLPYAAVLRGFGSAARLFGDPELAAQVASALRLSLALATATAATSAITACAALLALGALGRRARAVAAALLMLPAGVSVLVLGLGTWFAYGRFVDPFEGSLGAMIALQTALFFPVAFRILWPVLEGTQRRLLEAAATLGAGAFRAFLLVEWPRWRRPLAAAVAVTLAASLGEVAAVSLFYSEKLIPLPLLVSRWSAQYRFEEAGALSALLLVLAGGAAALALGGRDPGGRVTR